MLQIAFLLCGREFLKKNGGILAIVGIIWGGSGLFILADGVYGGHHFPFTFFGWLLLCESIITLIASSGVDGSRRLALIFKGGIILGLSFMILSGRSGSNVLLAILLGFFCFLSGVLVIFSAWIVRYPYWKKSFFEGVSQVLFAIFLFQPYIGGYQGTIPQFIGVVMILSAMSCVKLSLRIQTLFPGVTIFDIQAAGSEIYMGHVEYEIDLHHSSHGKLINNKKLRVLIWTPEGAAEEKTVPRPIFNRYIAAVDTRGVISTGHAALEMEDIYLSLYPYDDIDRSPSEFFHTLRAIQENNVQGEYQKDYISESEEWREADKIISFDVFCANSLRAFCIQYKKQDIYNLTWRNCSSSVAYGLEAALDGVLYNKYCWFVFFKLLMRPELWIAAQLRKRATTMAWTPGIVHDYARALHSLVHTKKLSWFKRK
ncbi:HdeD family acid-resistance protein [Klebsiella pneumoniae]